MNGGEWVWVPEQEPTLWTLLAADLQPLPVLPAIGFVLAVLYLAGAVRLWVIRRRWSVVRTLSFLLGCVLLVLTTGLAIEGYGYALFSVFMFQQLTLMIAIPPLLVLGSPGTLLLRAVPHRGLGRVVLRLAFAGLRSRVSRWLLHPALGIPICLLSFYGLYLGGLADVFLASSAGHISLEVLFLVAGMLFTIPILSADPLPIRLGYGGRLLDILVEMALHAFFGVIVMMTPGVLVEAFATPPAAWRLDPVADQQIAGGLAWSYGEGPTALILIYLLHRWYRADTTRARAADRQADELGDPDLAAYNAYLAGLRGGDHNRPTPNTLKGELK